MPTTPRSSLRALNYALVLALLFVSSRARGEARLLVLSPVEESPRPTLVEALRLHLRGTARVEASGALFPALPGAGRVALATELVGSQHVQFALWLESVGLADGTRLFALYVVGGQPGRAVLEVVRLPAEADTPDVDRTLALKASEIIDAALAPAVVLEPPGARTRRPPSETTKAQARRFALELGGTLKQGRHESGQVGLSAGVSLLTLSAPLELDVRLWAQTLNESQLARPPRHVEIGETYLGSGVGARSNGMFQLGAKLGVGVRLLHAEGFSGRERTGSTFLALPSLSLGPELRLKIGPRIRFSAELAAEWLTIRQSFHVDQQSIADLGRFRGNAQLSLIFLIL